MRPDKRVKSKEECIAMCMMFNGTSDHYNVPRWWYGDKSHVLFHRYANLQIQGETVDRYCADTMQQLTAAQVRERILEWEECCTAEAAEP